MALSNEQPDPQDAPREFVKHADIRDVIGHFVGRTIADITQSDLGNVEQGKYPFIQLDFTDGSQLIFPIVDGEEGGFWFDDPPDGQDRDHDQGHDRDHDQGQSQGGEWNGFAGV